MSFLYSKTPETDCFAYNKEKKCCNALSELMCANKNCKFYKNKANVDLDAIEDAIARYGRLR